MKSMQTKTLTIVFACIGLVVLSLQALAQTKSESSRKTIAEHLGNFYMRVGAGKRYGIKEASFLKRPRDNGVFNAGIGYRFSGYPVRAELDMQNANFSISGSQTNWIKARTRGYMLNLYRDFNVPKDPKNITSFVERISPYLTAGLGTAKYGDIRAVGLNKSGNLTSYNYSSKNRFAWGGGLGIRYYLDRSLSLDIGFKYVDLGSITTGAGKVKVRGYQGVIALLLK